MSQQNKTFSDAYTQVLNGRLGSLANRPTLKYLSNLRKHIYAWLKDIESAFETRLKSKPDCECEVDCACDAALVKSEHIEDLMCLHCVKKTGKCPVCRAPILWSGVLTEINKNVDYRVGDCSCGENFWYETNPALTGQLFYGPDTG